MRRSSIPRRAAQQLKGKASPLADLVWLCASPVVRVQQYMAELAAGNTSRLKLIWSRSHSSFDEWCDACPDQLLIFRNCLECATTWLDYRGLKGNMCVPWLWAGTVDRRRETSDRVNLRKQLFHLPPELCDDWFHDNLVRRIGSESALDDPGLDHALHLWAWEVVATNAQPEINHS